MKQASVRDLRYDFPRIEAMLREGEEIEITRHRKVICKLVPAAAAVPVAMPDFMARLREAFGDKKMAITGAQIVAEDRDRY